MSKQLTPPSGGSDVMPAIGDKLDWCVAVKMPGKAEHIYRFANPGIRTDFLAALSKIKETVHIRLFVEKTRKG